jgi:positive regulator of sigma E activity
MTAEGVVRGTAAGGRIEVELAAPLRCRGCEGLCTWRALPPVHRAVLVTSLPFAVGDRVSVSLPERYVVAGAAVAHGLPLASLLVGALAGFAVTGTDVGSVIGAAVALAIAFAATPILRRRTERMLVRALVVERRRASAG